MEINTKTMLRVNAAMLMGYGIGCIFVPEMLVSTYFSNQSAINNHGYYLMKCCGISYCLLAGIFLAIGDGASESMKKCVLSIMGLANLVSAYFVFDNQNLFPQFAYYQLLIMNVGLGALNLNLGAGVFKVKSS